MESKVRYACKHSESHLAQFLQFLTISNKEIKLMHEHADKDLEEIGWRRALPAYKGRVGSQF